VLLWFVGGAIVAVWYVFRDPTFDLRVLVLGVLLADLVEIPMGGAGPLHSVLVSVIVLIGVVLATIGRRKARKRLLALPIGMMLHLVLDGAFTRPEVFWWPFLGDPGDIAVPSVDRGWWNVGLEIIGALLCLWVWRRFDLADRERRSLLVRSGRLDPVDTSS
jgi:hypothetical protein